MSFVLTSSIMEKMEQLASKPADGTNETFKMVKCHKIQLGEKIGQFEMYELFLEYSALAPFSDLSLPS